MEQLSIGFSSKSPLNTDRMTRQNRFLYNHLASGKTITSKEAMLLYGISRLSGRIHELRKEVVIIDRFIKVDGVDFKEYSIFPFPEQTP